MKDQLTYYWMMVLVYFSLWLIDWNFLNEIFLIVVGIVVVPMTIAGYLIYIISSIKKSLKA
ncbi:MAG: hypothetical protein GKR88_04870 [Flavobacteriaceae bacterium]|nr:MAG: hypothetical protein GKR88_04870 [Flavobacteriaceae bacterium]